MESYKPLFHQTKREKKREFAADIMFEFKKSGGRFLVEYTGDRSKLPEHEEKLAKDEAGGDGTSSDYILHPNVLSKLWVCADDEKVIKKVW